ncbi:Cytochrome P450 [Mycena sanguinolenta]|uniref:Cytochrome P450 n=1 Tax=Mycena sanguinolenta TaxID=230812 RepID=A0A8H7D3K5_9AGAR|nr:Cytochrome P450 [Mycena sanguinolenta]
MSSAPHSIRATVLQQTERARRCSKAEIERFIEKTEQRIISLESQINALIELRDSQRACVLALKNMASPIHSLPIELLVEIFDLAVEDYWHVENLYCISQVCWDWRQVAQSTPRLWTRPVTIVVSKAGGAADELESLPEVGDATAQWKTWLARSAPLPIHISLVKPRFDYRDINRYILEEGLRVAHRCASLRIDIKGSGTPSWFVRRLAQSKLDSLDELDLGYVQDDDTDRTSVSFTAASRLQKLHLINLGALQIALPWAQLTELRFHCDSPEAFEAFRQCANLIRVYINILQRTPFFEVRQDMPIQFGQLCTLSLHSWTGFPFFFYRLSTPALQELQLHGVRWIPADFTAFQLRAPNITSLELIDSYSCVPRDMKAAICDTPSLTHLTIKDCKESFDDAFISSLCYKDGLTPLVPRLHHLVVDSNVVNFTEDVLASMIMSRWWTETERASYAAPPVARWTYVELRLSMGFRPYQLGARFTEPVKTIPPDVLIYRKDVVY